MYAASVTDAVSLWGWRQLLKLSGLGSDGDS